MLVLVCPPSCLSTRRRWLPRVVRHIGIGYTSVLVSFDTLALGFPPSSCHSTSGRWVSLRLRVVRRVGLGYPSPSCLSWRHLVGLPLPGSPLLLYPSSRTSPSALHPFLYHHDNELTTSHRCGEGPSSTNRTRPHPSNEGRGTVCVDFGGWRWVRVVEVVVVVVEEWRNEQHQPSMRLMLISNSDLTHIEWDWL